MRKETQLVCIIDDDDSVRAALCRLIRSSGMRSVGFASVDDFLSNPEAKSPDCIVADVRMPGTNGLQLPEKLRAIGQDVPVIFVTAQHTEETRAMAKAAGAAGYFCKPVDDQALLDAIEWVYRKGT